MKKPFMLSLLSVFVFSIILSGCGWIKTEKEFSNWLDGYTDKEGQAHEGFQSKVDKADQALSDRVSELDGKVDAQNEALSGDIQQAKEAAIAAAEAQGHGTSGRRFGSRGAPWPARGRTIWCACGP